MRGLFTFPNPVNEVSARLVAAGVVALAAVILIFDQHWLLFVLTYGFLARVLTGPTLSPLGTVVTRFITPKLPVAEKLVAGPPKRFAQAIGLLFSATALLLYYVLGASLAADVVLGMLIFAATLEAVFGICLGCKVFALLMRAGLVPEKVCVECADIWNR